MAGAGMSTLAFFVPGLPKPQGSKRHVGNGVMIESANISDWRTAVATVARQAALTSAWPLVVGGPVEVVLTFHLQAPKTRPRELPCVRPDIDKLARAVLDSLTVACVFRDDSRVTDLIARKRYADDTQPLGCDVEVTAL